MSNVRKSKVETAESRRRIVSAAARLYQEKGFDGVAVADIMEAAGMTHGGFYRHFESKEALIGEAMKEVFHRRASALVRADGTTGLAPLREYIRMYLSKAHRDSPGEGCPVAAVGSEAQHVGGDISRVFNEGMEMLVERMATSLGDADGERAQALRILSTLVGAVVIARAAGQSASIRDEVLDAVRDDGNIRPLLRAE